MSDMLCWKQKIHPKDSSSVVGPLPLKEQPNDLIIINQEALDKEIADVEDADARPDRLTPVIRGWEGEFEGDKETSNQDQETQFPSTLISYTAWDNSFEKEDAVNTTLSNPNIAEKVKTMAHELVHLMTGDASEEKDGSDVELEDVVKTVNAKARKKEDVQNLLKARHEDDDEDDDDNVELRRIISLEDGENKPSFGSAQLVFRDSPPATPSLEPTSTSEGSVTENIYVREHSAPVVIEQNDPCLVNPAFTEDAEPKVANSRSSSTSKHSIHSNSSGTTEEVIEMRQLRPEPVGNSPQLSASSEHLHEETRLLSVEVGGSRSTSPAGYTTMNNDEVSNNDDNIDDNASDVSSEGSEFLGSLGIYMPEGTWESDLRVELDLQLGRDEWNSSFQDIEGDATLDGWGTHLAEISKGNAKQTDWSSSLPEISDTMSVKSDWNSSLTDRLIKEDKPEDWQSQFNKIEKLQNDRNQWRTILTKIKERVYDKNEWKFSLRKISNRKQNSGNDWSFNLTEKFRSNNDKRNDWNCKFNQMGNVTLGEDDWRLRARKMDVRSDDRRTHWNTKFLKIADKDEDEKTWQTRFNKIEPIPEDKTWETSLIEPSDDLGSPQDWNIKFIDIESNSDKPDTWETLMRDTPNSKRDPADWNFRFKQLEEHLKNPKEAWAFKFNSIIENQGKDRELWKHIFKEMDHGDNEAWMLKFNEISEAGDPNDWTLEINTIEGAAEGEGEE